LSLTERIKYLASQKKENFTSIERALGFGQGTIRRWDTSNPSVDKLIKLANFLSVSTDWLLGMEREADKASVSTYEYACKSDELQLTVEERLLLDNYRDIPSKDEKLDIQKKAALLAAKGKKLLNSQNTNDDSDFKYIP
jgi:transcriptional regulator with XRE-family HTH domain